MHSLVADIKHHHGHSQKVAEHLLHPLGLTVTSCTELQTLWAGYGHICAITAVSSTTKETSHLILKLISPPSRIKQRKSDTDESHLRKMFSYEIEQYFYTDIAPDLPVDVAVAQCVAYNAFSEDLPMVATVLTDLRQAFPVPGEKRGDLSQTQVLAALDWLAKFHASSWTWLPDVDDLGAYARPPLEEVEVRRAPGARKLWLNGGYTYLATRQSELANLASTRSSEWSAAFTQPTERRGPHSNVAEIVAEFLTPCGREFESMIHGDVKSENLFSNAKGTDVAFFDFQYVGLGLGVCDLAKLFTCSVPLGMLTRHEAGAIPHLLHMDDGEKLLLERYRETLLARRPQGGKRGPRAYHWAELVRHWETALVDWCRFQASWGFWGNTEWLEARTRKILADKQGWWHWINEEVAAIHDEHGERQCPRLKE